jgi:hypothetical protein
LPGTIGFSRVRSNELDYHANPIALIAGDTRRLRAVLDLGCATSYHAEFVARPAKARSER